ncbi:MAG: elongation factor P [Candidatus Bipolaricaulis anaerobius]|nr:elongation factor P [Candidatus Bipolaricaulis anaerobius]
MGISIGEISRGMTLIMDGELYEVTEFEHVKLGRGGAFVRAKMKDLRTGRVISKTLKDSDNLETAYLETRILQYLYQSGGKYTFMDKETFEQYELDAEVVEPFKGYLVEGLDFTGLFYQDRMVKVVPPNFVDLRVTEAPPGIKGDTATGGEKPATLQTGLVVKVLLFVTTGEVIRVDTRSGAYVERVS